MDRETAFLLLVIAVAGLVTLFIALPFLQYILGAIIVAYVLHPLHVRLAPYVGRRLSPLVLIVALLFVVFVPVGYVTVALVRDLRAFSRGETGFATEGIETSMADLTGQQVDLSARVSSLGRELFDLLFGSVSELVSFGVTFSTGFGLMLFLVYYLLRDGEAFVDWVIDTVPATNAFCDRMLDRIDRTTWGVVVGHLFVAALQGLVGGVGLLVAGIPNPVFWTFVMLLFALLPLIGAFFVWAPAATYLLLIDNTAAGIFLVIYGVLIVSTIDNYARPLVIDREAHLSPAVVLIGVFGGVFAIGVTGLFIGPIVIAVLVATLVSFNEEFDESGERVQH
jgi:predicted PurR-regulated permease PerM